LEVIVFTIETALKQLDVTEKQVRRIRAELPRLNREKVDKEMKLLLLDLQLMRNDLKSISNKEKDEQ
tara:strand:+ start:81 stop:281 length:201 start_codon:yes stop_codon:yes gene_type:complete